MPKQPQDIINIIQKYINKRKLIPNKLKYNASQDYINKPLALIRLIINIKIININEIKYRNKEKTDLQANQENINNILIAEYSSI